MSNFLSSIITTDLPTFLLYLHSSCYSTFRLLLSYLPNSTLKSLRLTIKPLSPHLFPYLFRRIYISAHPVDLSLFQHLSSHPSQALHHVPTELLWDDTTFDAWISGQQTYTDRLTQLTPLPSHVLHADSAASNITQAYRFWAREASTFAENRLENLDREIFESTISSFPNLRFITILSRSRLTYVDPQAYWTVWQTPRSQAWRAHPFSRYLLQPEPFKSAIDTTVRESEGLRPVRIIIDAARKSSQRFKIGALVIQSIGSGQTRATGIMNWNRYERKWHHDLHRLTATRDSTCGSGKVVLNLLIETQMENLFRHENLWMDLLDELMEVGQETLEEIAISNVCYDWFWEYQQSHPGMMLERCRGLRRVILEGGWCQNIAELLVYLRKQVGVAEVSVSEVDVEPTSWLEVLQVLKQSGTTFDYFQVQASRCPADFYPWQVDSSWAAPWSGDSEAITSWLRGEKTDFPLSQGPG